MPADADTCTFCGALILNDAPTCKRCGRPVVKATTEPAPKRFGHPISRRAVLLGLAGCALTGGAIAGAFLVPRPYVYRGHTDRVVGVAWSPDGRRIASCSWDRTVQVWDAFTGDHVLTYQPPTPDTTPPLVAVVGWSPDGKQIASAANTMVYIWDAVTGHTRLAMNQIKTEIRAMAWSPNSQWLAIGQEVTSGSPVQVWNAVNGQLISTYTGQQISVEAVAWSPDGKRVASASGDQTVQVWNATTAERIVTYRHIPRYNKSYPSLLEYDAAWAIGWSPDGRRIASGYIEGGGIQIWDADTGRLLLHYGDELYGTVTTWVLAWSPDGTRILTAGNSPKIWDATTGEHIYTYGGHTYPEGTYSVLGAAWSPDGRSIATASSDKTVQVWPAP